MKHIVELCISNCNSVTSFPFSILPTTLKRIEISGCRKLKLETPVGEMSMFLVGCNCIDDISPELIPSACRLNVSNCHNLTRFLIPTATESVYILGCENLEILSLTCGKSQMTYLQMYDCKKLKWLPEHMQKLKQLNLSNCPEIESFPEGGFPLNLQQLSIGNGRKEWRLPRLPCLTELRIVHDGSDEEIVGGENWELPSSIQTLIIYNVKTLSSQHLKSLTSLQHLTTFNLAQIQSLLEVGQLPSSLSELKLYDHHELHSLGLWHLTSLRLLHIVNFPNLQSLSESALPSSLSELTIYDCPNLQSLPVKGMPSSLSILSIHNCPLLRPLLEFDKGEYWPEIAQIPIIDIDREYL